MTDNSLTVQLCIKLENNFTYIVIIYSKYSYVIKVNSVKNSGYYLTHAWACSLQVKKGFYGNSIVVNEYCPFLKIAEKYYHGNKSGLF